MAVKYIESMDLDLTINGNEVIIDELSLKDYPKKSIWRTHKFTKDILLQIENTLNNLPIATKEQDTFHSNIISVWHKRFMKSHKIDVTSDELTQSGFTYINEYLNNKIYIQKHTDVVYLYTFCIDRIIDFHIINDTWCEILTFIKQSIK